MTNETGEEHAEYPYDIEITNSWSYELQIQYYTYIGGKILTYLILLLCAYVFIVHIIYCYKKYKKLKFITSLCKCSSSSNGKFILDFILGITTLSLLTRMIIDLELYAGNKLTDEICLASERFEIMTIIISTVSVYLCLWFRHKLIYSHRALEPLRTVFVQFLRIISMVLIVTGTLTITILYVVLTKLRAVKYGCEYDKSLLLYYQRYYITMGVCTCIQGTLLLMFIYPLLLHGKTQMFGGVSSRINATMRRVAVAAIICSVSDLFAGLISAWRQDLYNVVHSLYEVNAFVNGVCIFASYANWKQRLFPMIATKRPQRSFSNLNAINELSVSYDSKSRFTIN